MTFKSSNFFTKDGPSVEIDAAEGSVAAEALVGRTMLPGARPGCEAEGAGA